MPTPPKRVGIVAFVALSFLILVSGCAVRRNGLNIPPPKVYPDSIARASLRIQSDAVVKAAEGIAATGIQEFASAREVTAANLAIQVAIPTTTPAGTAASPPAPHTAGATPLPDRPIGAPSALATLAVDGIDDLTAKVAEVESVRLLYAGDVNASGPNARLFLLRFDILVDPSRQNPWSYLVRWADCFHTVGCKGFRNYTKDYQAEVNFVIPSDLPLEVYAVQPERQTLGRLEANASAYDFGLAAAGAAQGGAAQADYRNRLEEQFAEQSKFPLIQGIIDSKKRFRFVFNPRRRVVRRSLLARVIPFVNDYDVRMQLESGVRRVYAYLIAPDFRKLAEAKRQASNGQIELSFSAPVSVYTKGMALPVENADVLDQTEPNHLLVSIQSWGRYYNFGSPFRNDPLFFRYLDEPRKPSLCTNAPSPPEECEEENDENRGDRMIDVSLPLEPKREDSGWYLSPTVVVTSGASPVNLVTLCLREGVNCKHQGDEKIDYKGASISLLEVSTAGLTSSKSKLTWVVDRPDGADFLVEPLPKDPKPTLGVKLKAVVVTGGRVGWTNELEYKGPWAEEKKPPSPIHVGKAGHSFVFEIPKALEGGRKVSAVQAILFGGEEAKRIDPTAVDAQKSVHTVAVIVPRSVGTIVEVRALVTLDSPGKNPQLNAPRDEKAAYMELGRFVYEGR